MLLPLLLLLAACSFISEAEWQAANDRDADGFLSAENGGADCDDGDASIHPSAVEVCNGLDDDCDGESDEDAVDVRTWYQDADGDGYGDPQVTVMACEQPSQTASNDEDCDDGDSQENPLAVWYPDDDGDGYGYSYGGQPSGERPEGYEGEGGDCDDDDATIHPAASEECDGVDNDCDELTDEDLGCPVRGEQSLSQASATLLGDEAGDYTGYALASTDADGDGYQDLLIGSFGASNSSGTLHVVIGPASGAQELVEIGGGWAGEEDSYAGYRVAACDLDGDGLGDLLTGAVGEDSAGANAGAAYLVLDPIEGGGSLPEADTVFYGEREGDWAGYGLDCFPMDEDEHPDVLLGAPQNDEGGENAGAAYVVRASFGETVDLGEAHTKLIGEAAGDWAGYHVHACDLDGTGLGDVVIGAYHEGTGGKESGAVYLVCDPPQDSVDLAEADAKLVGAGPGHRVGYYSVSCDMTGDGYAEVLVAAWGADEAAGAVYIVSGSTKGELNLTEAKDKLLGETAADQAGVGLDAAHMDDDIWGDALVGANGEDSAATAAGAVYIAYGPLEGALPLSAELGAKLWGEQDYDQAARVHGRDLDGDGTGDLLIGAWGANEETGAAYVVMSPGD